LIINVFMRKKTVLCRFGEALLRFRIITTVLAVVLMSNLAWAQKPRVMPRAAPHANQPRKPAPQPAIRGGPDQHPHPPGFYQRLRDLPPAQQERVLANDARFQQLPPERQAQIRDNLQKWNNLNPQQKEVTRQRQEILESLSPAQREQARFIFPQYNRLPPGRKQAVMAAFRRARDLPPAQRERFLSSPQVENRYSPQELEVLRGLTRLLPEQPGGAGGGPEN
jgi:hypothetical protein